MGGVLRFFGMTVAGRVLAAAIVVGLVGGLVVAPRLGSGAAATPTRTQTVSRGNVTQTIAVSGAVNASAQFRAGFKASGRLSEILVKVGDAVALGQPLARIDSTDLQTAVKQAEANLLSAQAKYDTTVSGATAEDLALAKNSLDNATLSYEQAKKNAATDVTNAQATLDKSKRSYETARVNFQTLTTAIEGDATAYRDAIGTVAGPVLASRGTVETYIRPGDVTTARNALVSAEQALANAQTYAAASMPSALADYAGAVDLVRSLADVFDRWTADGRDTASLGPAIQTAQLQYQTAATRMTAAIDAPAGQISSALSSVQAAQTALTSTSAATDPTFDQVRLDIVRILAALTSEQQLASSVKSRVGQATTALTPISDAVSGTYAAAIAAAQTAQDKATTTLASQDISLRNAQLSFQKSTATPKSTDIALAQASLQLAQIALDKTRNDLNNATLVAPTAGKIVSVASQIGENPANPFIVVAATGTLTLHGTVGESEIAKLKNGQVATISVDAVGSATRMTGRVTSLDPVATIQQGVPVYGVDITLDIPDEAVRPGMTGSANVIIASKQGVLTVPNSAIRTSGGIRTLQIMRDGKVEDALVTFGISNDTVTEVLTGLTEGELVVLPTPRTTTTTTAGQQRGGGGVGGFGGAPVIVGR